MMTLKKINNISILKSMKNIVHIKHYNIKFKNIYVIFKSFKFLSIFMAVKHNFIKNYNNKVQTSFPFSLYCGTIEEVRRKKRSNEIFYFLFLLI